MAKEGRTTVYNQITTKEKLEEVNPDNLQLADDFIEYLESIDRAKGTIKQYRANLNVFWCWNLEFNKNKFFVDLTKREIAKFQSYAMNTWQWSPKRIRTVKAAISSLSNYIENILDDEYDGYKPIIRKIESPADTAVRTKTVFQDEDLEQLLNELVEREQYMKACALSLAMNSGRRKAELPRFKVSYFSQNNLICDSALYKTPEKVTTKGRGTRGKQLDLYTLSKPFQPYLNLWLKERERLGIKTDWLFPKYKDGQWIDEHVEPVTLDSWARTFSSMLGKSFYWHSLRHYFTTKLKSSGIPDSVVQDVIGWDSADMVKVYDDTPSEEQFEKYFGSDGIKEVKQTSLNEL
jgi:integrase